MDYFSPSGGGTTHEYSSRKKLLKVGRKKQHGIMKTLIKQSKKRELQIRGRQEHSRVGEEENWEKKRQKLLAFEVNTKGSLLAGKTYVVINAKSESTKNNIKEEYTGPFFKFLTSEF